MSDQSCFVTLVTIELVIPHAQSLKDKRREVRGLKDRIRHKFNASIAEVAFQDKWQRAVIAACLIGNDKRKLISDTARMCSLFEESAAIEIAHIDQEWL